MKTVSFPNNLVAAAAVLESDELKIEHLIYTVRGVQVMLDRDLARLYEVETKALNQAVKRNPGRFPEDFMFRLTKEEWDCLRSQNVTSNETGLIKSNDGESLKSLNGISKKDGRGGIRYIPFAFTEEGVSQLSGVLKSNIADSASVRIMRAFVAMRRFISSNAGINQRLTLVERKQLETDARIDRVLDCLEEGTLKEKAHVFSAGQIYDAKSFISELIGRAKRRVVLIDGYVNSVTIDLLDARADSVSATIYTNSVSALLTLLRDQYVTQYPGKPLLIKKWQTVQHDRWIIIDDELWHCGASLKDAGGKTFGIDPIGLDASIILGQV